jgi:hypothetical protein
MGKFTIAILLATPLLADTGFTIRRMSRNDVQLGKGQCDIRLQVDGEAEVSVSGDRVSIRTLAGRDARDDGSECNEPFPRGEVQNFNYEVKDSRGEIVLLDQPSRRNGNRAVVRIRDPKGGEGRYHFRLTWDVTGSGGGYGGSRDGGSRDGGYQRPGFGGGPQQPNRFTVKEAINVCQEDVRSRIFNEYRFTRVDFRAVRADDRPGRNDFIIGEASGRRGNVGNEFNFVCRVDFSSGSVRQVDVTPRR